MIFIYIIIAFIMSDVSLVNGDEGYACSNNFCIAFGSCPKFSCKRKDEIVLSNSTDCGCCHRCIKELEEGDDCTSEMTYNTPDTQCGPHLYCLKENGKSTCKKISEIKQGLGYSKCERTAFDLGQKLSQVTTGHPIPECDEFGYYAPYLCKNGTLCHCVDQNGTRIFGTDTYDQRKYMNCLCSRQFSEVNNKLGKYNIDPINFIRCKSNGNYEPFQMVNDYTYCINTTSGVMADQPVVKSNQDTLPCIGKKSDYSQETACIKLYKNVTKEIEKKQDLGFLVVGYDIPNCDIDGSFKPVQCLNSHCYCVNKKGEKYKGTQVYRNSHYAVNQTCNCIRELELIRTIPKNKWDKVTELFTQYICDINGNYYPLQCSESVCYCVDKQTGFQKGQSVLKTDKQQMYEQLKDIEDCWDADLDRTYNDYYQDQF